MLRSVVSIWPWFVAGAVLTAGAGLVFRRRLRFYLKVAKALVSDERLPRPLRWVVGVGLAAKAMPVDFGIDEVALGLAAVLLATRYRGVLRAIVSETRAEDGAIP